MTVGSGGVFLLIDFKVAVKTPLQVDVSSVFLWRMTLFSRRAERGGIREAALHVFVNLAEAGFAGDLGVHLPSTCGEARAEDPPGPRCALVGDAGVANSMFVLLENR